MDLAKFVEFHESNPGIYTELVRLAREAQAKGRTKFAIKRLTEQIRWDRWWNTGEEFEINNDLAPYYSRLIMGMEPGLEGLFEIRKSRADLEMPAYLAALKAPRPITLQEEEEYDLDYWLGVAV